MTTPSKQNRSTGSPLGKLYEHILGGITLQMLYVVASLKIADLIHEGETSVDGLAKATGTNAEVLCRILKALSGIEIFVETTDQHFELTTQAELLCVDAPQSTRPLIMLIGSDWHSNVTCHLMDTVRTGGIAFDAAYGEPLFDHLQKNSGFSQVYNNAMTGQASEKIKQIIECYDFSQFDTLIDVGGGHGTMLAEILKSSPQLKGILFDMPGVSKVREDIIQSAGVADRCTVVEGSFFDSIPSGVDGMIMKTIIHDWNDEQSRQILQNCHVALNPSGKLLLCEMILPGKNIGGAIKHLDIEMLIMSGGQERTEEEYRHLLKSSGFTLENIFSTQAGPSVLECTRNE